MTIAVFKNTSTQGLALALGLHVLIAISCLFYLNFNSKHLIYPNIKTRVFFTLMESNSSPKGKVTFGQAVTPKMEPHNPASAKTADAIEKGKAALTKTYTPENASISTPNTAIAAQPTPYLQALRLHLKNTLQYPKLSLVQGEEGTVVISMRVDSSGNLMEFAILTPSKFPRLNAAALSLVSKMDPKKVGLLPDFDVSLPVEIPIQYALNSLSVGL